MIPMCVWVFKAFMDHVLRMLIFVDLCAVYNVHAYRDNNLKDDIYPKTLTFTPESQIKVMGIKEMITD